MPGGALHGEEECGIVITQSFAAGQTLGSGLDRSLRGYALAAFVSLELLMSFSFLGYLHIEPISITFAYIPVLVAGALLGPVDSMIVGAAFGFASMWKAGASYVMPFDQLFSPTLSGSPAESTLLALGARMLFGLTVGLLYTAARRMPHTGLWVMLISLFGRSIHSTYVYTVLWLFFPETGYRPWDGFWFSAGLKDLLTDLVTTLIVLLCWRLIRSGRWQQFQSRVTFSQDIHQPVGRSYTALILTTVTAVLASAFAVTLYFVYRMDSVLERKGVSLDAQDLSDFFHLQVQFLLGILSMMTLLMIVLFFNRRYAAYAAFEARKDALTGALNRKAFFQACGQQLRGMAPSAEGSWYFVMVDLDYFKEINDRYGHPEGDRALQEAAWCLREVFGREGLVGRVGGDELALLLCVPVTREELSVALRHFLDRIHRVVWQDRHLTCSIGALPVPAPRPVEKLYEAADQVLYIAKEQGRDRFVIAER